MNAATPSTLAVIATVACLVAVSAVSLAEDATPQPQLANTVWQLVKFEAGNGRVVTPQDPTRYRVTFGTGGRLIVEFDCNRGRGTWNTAPPDRIGFGGIAMTRMRCAPGSFFDQLARDWGRIRTYAVADQHLYLTVADDGGVYEFSPLTPATG